VGILDIATILNPLALEDLEFIFSFSSEHRLFNEQRERFAIAASRRFNALLYPNHVKRQVNRSEINSDVSSSPFVATSDAARPTAPTEYQPYCRAIKIDSPVLRRLGTLPDKSRSIVGIPQLLTAVIQFAGNKKPAEPIAMRVFLVIPELLRSCQRNGGGC